MTWSKNRISVRVEQAVCASEWKTEDWVVRGGRVIVPDTDWTGVMEENVGNVYDGRLLGQQTCCCYDVKPFSSVISVMYF